MLPAESNYFVCFHGLHAELSESIPIFKMPLLAFFNMMPNFREGFYLLLVLECNVSVQLLLPNRMVKVVPLPVLQSKHVKDIIVYMTWTLFFKGSSCQIQSQQDYMRSLTKISIKCKFINDMQVKIYCLQIL